MICVLDSERIQTSGVISDGKVNIFVFKKIGENKKKGDGKFYTKPLIFQNILSFFEVFRSLKHKPPFLPHTGKYILELSIHLRSESFFVSPSLSIQILQIKFVRIACRNIASISNFGVVSDGKRSKVYISNSFQKNRFFYMVVTQKLIIVNTRNFNQTIEIFDFSNSNFYEISQNHKNLQCISKNKKFNTKHLKNTYSFLFIIFFINIDKIFWQTFEVKIMTKIPQNLECLQITLLTNHLRSESVLVYSYNDTSLDSNLIYQL
ncbi:hypothetical protein AGLY_010310 [Aphis glycines]|uniref:Uncharacterized protein n=2 Tax=Aphis TaxID=464929 RepID=A0A6G0TGI0_APHGL|nr:hypothetical protein AGLY_010310 [Aphis glycines]